MDFDNLLHLIEQVLVLRGGAGSGNWGHVGRKGKRGGSGRGGGLAAIGAKPGSSHKERKQASQKTRTTREVKSKLLKDRALEDFSRDELLTLRSRIDQMLGDSNGANDSLKREQPETTHGHTVTVLGTDPSKKFEMRYEVRELDNLITSNNDSGSINPDFPKELQPRDRTRVASQRQIDSIAANLEPEALLGEFKAIDRGTPIIGNDNAVESGNGRSMALRRARDQHPEQYAKYQQELKKTAQDKGLDPASLEGFDNPVLVRVRKTDVDRVEFAKEANTASILGASDTERARSDASRISSEHLQQITTRDSIEATIKAPANRDFVRSFVANTPEVERATMIDRNGTLTASGENRIKAAMFNRVFDSPELSDRIFESTDNDIKNVTNGIMNSLGSMSRAEELVRTGQRSSGLSIAGDITKTVQVYSSLKDRNLSVSDFLAQGALFGRELNAPQEKILVEIDKRRRSGKQLSEFFGGWSDLIEGEPHPSQGSLFGGGGGRSKDQLIDAWISSAGQSPQPGLFTTAAAIITLRGGPTSGNWGHVGRPGKKGGSKRGGGFEAINASPRESRRIVKEAAAKERQARKEGIVRVSPAKLAEARATVAAAKQTRDRSLKTVRVLDNDITKAQSQDDTNRTRAHNAQNKLWNSMDKQEEIRGKILDLSSDSRNFFANKPKIDKLQVQLEKEGKKREALALQLQAKDEKLKRSTNKLNELQAKRNALPPDKATTEGIMISYQVETEGGSNVLFQHNLNEAKRVRVEMSNEQRVRRRESARLGKEAREEGDRADKLIKQMQQSSFADNDPRAIAMINKQLEHTDRQIQINKELRDLHKPSSKIKRLVAVDNPTKIVAASGSKRDKDIIEKGGWKKGREGFESLVSDDVVPAGTRTRFAHTSEDRSFHTSGGPGYISEVHMSGFAGSATMAHELGHMAEHNSPRLLQRSIEWRDKRTKDEKFRPLAELTGNEGYNDSEQSKADKFFSAYIGKDYGARATEVFSMGIEMMYKDPLKFAESDPDMFDFIYAQSRTP